MAEPDRRRQDRSDALTANDLSLFYMMLNDRQRESEAAGIARDEPSSVYRLQLLDQLRRRVIREREREAAEVTRLRELLATLEWAGTNRDEIAEQSAFCVVCMGYQHAGHRSSCELAAELAREEHHHDLGPDGEHRRPGHLREAGR